MAEPRNSHYVTEWQRPTDFGTVAVSDSNEPMGAVWAGVSSRDQPGYGFISESVPELSIAVFRGRRGEGIGGVLLRTCIERSRALGWSALSLNVEDGNHTALSLYQRHHFRVVGRNGESDTMLLDL
jgi:ribosomal protein S18 acetylase RimI-like enzyme